MKWIKRIVLVVVALVIIALAIVYFSLNSIIRTEVQKQASASLDVPTTLGSAHLALFGGSVSLNDLEVSSPPSFSAPKMFTLGGVSVAVNYGQLTGTPIHVKQIIINNPKLVVEQSGMKLNIQGLMDQSPQTPTTSAGQPKPPIKLIIDDLQLNNAEVEFLPGLGLMQPITVPVPSLELKNVGNADGNQNGVAIKEVVMQVVTALAGKAGADGKLPVDLNKLLAGNLSNISQQLGGQFNQQFQSVAGSLGKNMPANLGNLIPSTTQPSSGQNPGNMLNNLLKKPAK